MSVSVSAAGDSQRHAGLPQAVQWEAERLQPLARAQRADHHGETMSTFRLEIPRLACSINPLFVPPRLCTTTCPVRTTCSLSWPGSPSWRKLTFTWRGNGCSPGASSMSCSADILTKKTSCVFLISQFAEFSDPGPPASPLLCRHVLPVVASHAGRLCSNQHTKGKDSKSVFCLSNPAWLRAFS